jgi:hypothetical protein
MIGSGYWFNSIVVTYGYAGSGNYGWSAKAGFYDEGFANDFLAGSSLSTQGELTTRYVTANKPGVDKEASVEVVLAILADLTTMGIKQFEVFSPETSMKTTIIVMAQEDGPVPDEDSLVPLRELAQSLNLDIMVDFDE